MTGEPLDQQTVTCADVHDRDLLAAYLAGHLAENERDAVESHAIECAGCSNALQALLAARDELARSSAPGGGSMRIRPIVLSLLAAAALVAVAVIVSRGLTRRTAESTLASSPGTATPATQPGEAAALAPAISPALAELARVEPPPYSPFTVRSADEGAATFADAMAAYSAGDFARAAEGLRRVTAADPSNTEAHFYLGVSLMEIDDAPAAGERFRSVIAAGDSPFQQSARLFLAKSLIRTGDLEGAARELAATARGSGARAAEAADVLQKLRATMAHPR